MKVAIVGSRKFGRERTVRLYVDTLNQEDTVVSGGAEGPDSWAESRARWRGMRCIIYPVGKVDLPPYPEGRAEYGRRAYARNTLIAQECDRLVAFWDGESRGTENTIDEVRRLGKPVEVIGS